ncbi:MAG TPA: hypothetical protein V6C69_10425 [Trichormus sp.]
MYDCPTCKVPLHGHEEVCPSCGTKQYVRSGYRQSKLPPQPGVNPVPFVILAVVLVGIGIFAFQGSWMGQVLTKGAPPEDPLSKLTPIQARSMIEDGVTKGLTAAGAKCTFKYMANGEPALKNSPGSVELNVDTALKDPNARHAIFDPVKDYLAPAKISSMTINSVVGRETRTWTYAPSAMPSSTDTSGDTAQPDASQQQQ